MKLALVALLLTGCCAHAPAGPAWPKSAGPQGDVDRSKPDAWQEDGGDGVDQTEFGPASEVEGARLGPPDEPAEDDADEDADDADDDDLEVDGGEWVIELGDLDLD